MAAVPVTISGVLLDKLGRTIQQVTLVGEASMTGVGVGGGPIEGGPGEGPPGIWGPTDPRPTPPIANVPGAPGSGKPPSIWPSPGHPEHPIVIPPGIWPNPPEGQAPHPEHPIVIPPPPGTSGPPLEVKVVWGPENGWAVVLVPTGPHPSPSATPAGGPAGRRG